MPCPCARPRIAAILLFVPLFLGALCSSTSPDELAGRHALETGDYRGAIRHFTAAINNNPEAYDAYLGRARAYAALGSDNRALTDLRMAIQVDDSRSEPFLMRAIILVSLDDFEQALDSATAAIAIDDSQSEPFVLRAIIHTQLDDWERAVDDATAAIANDQSDLSAYVLRGVAHGVLGNLDDADSDLSNALAIDDSDALTYQMRAAVRYEMQDYAAAIDDSTEAIEQFEPGNEGQALLLRGLAYSASGDDKRAAADMRAALAMGVEPPFQADTDVFENFREFIRSLFWGT